MLIECTICKKSFKRNRSSLMASAAKHGVSVEEYVKNYRCKFCGGKAKGTSIRRPKPSTLETLPVTDFERSVDIEEEEVELPQTFEEEESSLETEDLSEEDQRILDQLLEDENDEEEVLTSEEFLEELEKESLDEEEEEDL